MILEGILATIGEDGKAHIAPMGAVLAEPLREPPDCLVLRPFQSTATFANLRRTGQGVFHVTDNVEMIARAAVGRLDPPPELVPAPAIEGWIVADACRWYALRVRRIEAAGPRAEIETEVVDSGRIRDFFGLNRAKHAVVEAAILATRIGLIPAGEIRAELDRLAPLVAKTGGRAERDAFRFLCAHVAQTTGGTS